jgi:hypothetical protein
LWGKEGDFHRRDAETQRNFEFNALRLNVSAVNTYERATRSLPLPVLNRDSLLAPVLILSASWRLGGERMKGLPGRYRSRF